MVGHGVGSGSPGGVGAEFGYRVTLIVRQIVVGEEIVAEDELPPCIFLPFRIARRICRSFAAVALRAIIGDRRT